MYQTTLKEIVQETPHVKLFRLHFPELAQFSFTPGQFVMIGHKDLKGETGLPVERAFSIASSPDQKDYLELCIKILEGGRFSDLCTQFREGEQLTLKGPFGKFQLRPELTTPLTFFAAGTGIAPIMSMLRHLAHKRFPQKTTLFFTFREVGDYIYRKELEELDRTYTNFTLVPTCTAQAPEGWDGRKGRFTLEYIKEHVAEPTTQYYFICGNNAFAKDIRAHLAELSIPKDNIKTEAWG